MLVNNKKYKLKIDITFIITLLAISFLLNKKIKISIKIANSIFAPVTGGRIFDAVVSDALSIKTVTLMDCNRP